MRSGTTAEALEYCGRVAFRGNGNRLESLRQFGDVTIGMLT